MEGRVNQASSDCRHKVRQASQTSALWAMTIPLYRETLLQREKKPHKRSPKSQKNGVNPQVSCHRRIILQAKLKLKERIRLRARVKLKLRSGTEKKEKKKRKRKKNVKKIESERKAGSGVKRSKGMTQIANGLLTRKRKAQTTLCMIVKCRKKCLVIAPMRKLSSCLAKALRS